MHNALVMRIAIPQWQGRIAPVFDVAGHLVLIDVEDNRETRREEKQLVKTELPARAVELLGYNADVLICGAISAPLQCRIAASGVRVIAFVCGAVDEVLAAYLTGALVNPAFAMPGCRRWRQRGGEDVLPVEFAKDRGLSSLFHTEGDFDMPFGDQAGPLGQGPMTGRGKGYCKGNVAPGGFNRPPGLGMYGGARTGRARQNRSRGAGLNAAEIPAAAATADRRQEIAELKSAIGGLVGTLDAIQKRLETLETSPKTE